ncbi:MAG: terpene cyclase/mutase family protein [Planctomycetota bacterium]|nr:terpene cyclase/mutase family protein [Planctomycetota bacterium]
MNQTLVAAVIFSLATCDTLHAQEPTDTAPAVSVFQKDATDIAIDKAIAYLISKQRDDGAIIDKSIDTTMTSLSIMAMASVGVQPTDVSPEGQVMQKALAFVLRDDRVDDKGYFGNKDGSRMYGHGIITLMLTEMLGMGGTAEQDQLIHDRCQKAIDVILSSQKEKKPTHYRGGWRYTPDSKDSDLSATVWQLMALRSAKNDGLQVPGTAIQDAVEYLKRSYASPLDENGLPEKKASGFSYEPHQNNPTYTMTAAGLLAMQVCGEYESPLVAGASDWLLEHPPAWNQRFCMYGTYYYSQGMYQRGGEHAKTAEKLVQEMLLEKQSGDGSWLAENGEEPNHGAVYSTTMSVLSLSVKYHYLPIYQR